MAFDTTKQIKFAVSVDGAEKVKSAFGGIGTSLEQTSRAATMAGDMLRTLGGTAAVGTLVHLVNNAIDAKAQLYDLGLKTGITVETLGGLSKVALLSGSDMQTVAASVAKLSKAMETTNEDSQGAAQGLKALGIEYNSFKALNADQQLVAVAKAMEGFADGSGKTAAAMLLFGKSGAEMLPFLKELAERGVMASTQTTKMAKAAKEFNDNLILLKGAGEGWATSLANLVLPKLGEFAKQMVEAKTASQQLAAIWSNIKANAGGEQISQDTMALKNLNQEFEATRHHIEQLEAAKAKGNLNAFGAAMLEQETAKLARLGAQASDAAEKLKRLANVSVGLPPEGDTGPVDTRKYPPKPKVIVPDFEAAKKAADEQFKVAMDLAKARSAIRQAESAAIAEFELQEQVRRNKEVEAARNAVAAAQFEYDAYGLLRSQIAELTLQRLHDKQAAFTVGSEDAKAVQQEIDARRELIDVLRRGEQRDEQFRNDPLAGANRAIKAYLDDVKAAGLTTERVVGDALHGLEDGMTELFTKGTFDVRAFIDQIIAEFIRLRVVRPLLADIFGGGAGGGAGGLLAMLFGGAGGAGAASTGAELSAAAGMAIGTFAMGGDPPVGRLSLVGEHGPELFVPHRAGTIVPNGQFGGKSVTVTYAPTINIDSRSDRAQVAQQTAQAVAAGNRQLVEMLRARGAL